MISHPTHSPTSTLLPIRLPAKRALLWATFLSSTWLSSHTHAIHSLPDFSISEETEIMRIGNSVSVEPKLMPSIASSSEATWPLISHGQHHNPLQTWVGFMMCQLSHPLIPYLSSWLPQDIASKHIGSELPPSSSSITSGSMTKKKTFVKQIRHLVIPRPSYRPLTDKLTSSSPKPQFRNIAMGSKRRLNRIQSLPPIRFEYQRKFLVIVFFFFINKKKCISVHVNNIISQQIFHHWRLKFYIDPFFLFFYNTIQNIDPSHIQQNLLISIPTRSSKKMMKVSSLVSKPLR